MNSYRPCILLCTFFFFFFIVHSCTLNFIVLKNTMTIKAFAIIQFHLLNQRHTICKRKGLLSRCATQYGWGGGRNIRRLRECDDSKPVRQPCEGGVEGGGSRCYWRWDFTQTAAPYWWSVSGSKFTNISSFLRDFLGYLAWRIQNRGNSGCSNMSVACWGSSCKFFL